MAFIQKESYKHKLAKELLCKWLEEDCMKKWWGDGVHMEYPIVPAMRQESFGNVIGYNYSLGDERSCYYETLPHGYNPTYEQCIAIGDIPVAILDIAVVYKGCVIEGFEIYHTHKVDNEKRSKLDKLTKRLGFKLYEIDAETILRQIEKPTDIYKLCNIIIDND